MRKILGLCGLAGAGKDTVASFFMERGWIRVGFADALYKEVAEAFGVSVAFLGNRETKEQPLPQMALINCKNKEFIKVFMREVMNNQEGSKMVSDDLIKELEKFQSPRVILQKWGTEFRRANYGDDYWRSQLAELFEKHPQENFIITDVRFPDEAKLIEQYGGLNARVIRPGISTLTSSTSHSSEQAMIEYSTPFEFINNEGAAGLANLRDQVVKILEVDFTVAA